MRTNLSQSHYKDFLDQLKDENIHNEKVKTSLGLVNVDAEFRQSSGSPDPTKFEMYAKGSTTMKAKKNSFLKVEEFRKSKQFRENKIPTNTSFSGMDKKQIQNFGLKYYDARKNQYQQNKNKSFDLINYQGKRKPEFTKRNNQTHNLYYNVHELFK